MSLGLPNNCKPKKKYDNDTLVLIENNTTARWEQAPTWLASIKIPQSVKIKYFNLFCFRSFYVNGAAAGVDRSIGRHKLLFMSFIPVIPPPANVSDHMHLLRFSKFVKI